MSEIVFPAPPDKMTEAQRLAYEAEVDELVMDYYELVEGFGLDTEADNSLLDKIENRGYNPNRDPKTGRFTYGPKKQAATIRSREKDIRFDKYETFVAVDGTGKIAVDKKGGKREVRISADEMKMLRDAKDLVYTHNHPSSASFSKSDLITGARIDAKEIRAISEKYEYSFKMGDMKFTPDTDYNWPAPEVIWNVYDYYDYKAFHKYNILVQQGKLTDNEAWLKHTHEVMEGVARRFNAEYTRKEL